MFLYVFFLQADQLCKLLFLMDEWGTITVGSYKIFDSPVDENIYVYKQFKALFYLSQTDIQNQNKKQPESICVLSKVNLLIENLKHLRYAANDHKKHSRLTVCCNDSSLFFAVGNLSFSFTQRQFTTSKLKTHKKQQNTMHSL